MKNNSIGKEKLIVYQKYIKQCKDPKTSNAELFELYKNATGEQKIIIRNKIVEFNLPLIVEFIIKKYNYDYDQNPVFDLDDVIQECNIMLISAIDEYNAEKGMFSTYVFHKIERSIYYINGIPNSPIQFYRGLASCYRKIKKLMDFDYTNEEISNRTEIDIRTVELLRPVFNSLSIEEISKGFIDNQLKMQDQLLGDRLIKLIDEEDVIKKRNSTLTSALYKLKVQDRLLLIKKYGLDGNNEEKSLREVNNYFNYSYSYIYKRFQYAIKKLAADKNLKKWFNEVDSDFDNNNKEKTYYLQK